METGAIIFLVFIGIFVTVIVLSMTGVIKGTPSNKQGYQNHMSGEQQMELGVINSLISNVMRRH
jgi:hypothetical protein